jgi:hypothetical protein
VEREAAAVRDFFLKVILIIKKMAKIVQCLKNCKNSTVFKKL